MTGCLEEENTLPALVPEEQIFKDEYDRREYIDNYITYTIDYMSSESNGWDLFETVDIVHLFKHPDIQIDDWDCITVGVSKMHEIIKIIDTFNEKHVTSKREAIIAERQAIIDAEYEEAVRKAEEKGKTYDKPKKEVYTDDLVFDNPYTYVVRIGEDSETPPVEYQPKLLIDPDRHGAIYLDVSKYGIPYVCFEFKSRWGMYNDMITQESDWVMNGVRAANVSAYMYDANGNVNMEAAPTFVDEDGLNKAAKQNIYMSGNIALGGEGFSWDSLMLLCNALELVNKGWSGNSFEQSSDENFTYYTLTMTANVFDIDPDLISSQPDSIEAPCIRLVATFNPLTQSCLNWTIDTYTESRGLDADVHELSDVYEVNVHEYKVDTNDYEGMRQSIKNWVNENAIKTDTVYYAFAQNKKQDLIGVLDTGIYGYNTETRIDGELYVCLEASQQEDGTIVGTYIKATDYEQAELEEDPEAYIIKHSVPVTIACCVVNEDGEILGYVVDGKTKLTQTNGTVYYIVDYEKNDSGFKDVKVMTSDLISRLLTVYTKTYTLNESQNAELAKIVQDENRGALALRDHVNEMFAEAEKTQKEQELLKASQLLAESTYANTSSDISDFSMNGETEEFKASFADVVIANGFTKGESWKHSTDVINFSATEYKNESNQSIYIKTNGDDIDVLATTTDSIVFHSGVKVGMTAKEVNAALNNSRAMFKDDVLILKNKSHTMIIELEGKTVALIMLVSNDYYQRMPKKEGVQVPTEEVVPDEQPIVEEDVETEAPADVVDNEQYNKADGSKYLAASADVNFDGDLAVVSLDDGPLILDSSIDEVIEGLGFQNNGPYLHMTDSLCVSGVSYIDAEWEAIYLGMYELETVEDLVNAIDSTDGKLYVFMTDSNRLTFYNGLKVGLSCDHAMAILANGSSFVDGVLIAKSESHTLVIYADENNNVQSIALVLNSYYDEVPEIVAAGTI